MKGHHMKITISMVLRMMILLGGCSYKTKINVSGGRTPDIELSGSGTMIDFTIYGPKQRAGEGRDAYTVWRLIPSNTTGDSDLGDLDDIGSIKYGTIPKGYRQVYPENNSPPQPLREGESYM